MKHYFLFALSMGVLGQLNAMGDQEGLRAPGGADQVWSPGGMLVMDPATAERFAQALNNPAITNENQELRTLVETLEQVVASQYRSIWRMRFVFIVAAAGFCYGMCKKVYELWNLQEENDVQTQAHGPLQKFIKSRKVSQRKPVVR